MSLPLLSELTESTDPVAIGASKLDAIDLTYDGVTLHVYGVLHGLTGGTNRDYVDWVNAAIHASAGLKLGEMGMTHLYRGLDAELDDWMQVPFRDALRLGLSLIGTPVRFLKLARVIIKEKTRRHDHFLTTNDLKCIGGSKAFHQMTPRERRELAGFSPPEQYLHVNLGRRSGIPSPAPEFPDTDWAWLTLIEPYANIPCRSVHMLEFAVAKAHRAGAREVSLFVGEIHNSDIEWLVNGPIPPEIAEQLQPIREAAKSAAKRVPWGRRGSYLLGAAIGVSLPIFVYAGCGMLLWWLAVAP